MKTQQFVFGNFNSISYLMGEIVEMTEKAVRIEFASYPVGQNINDKYNRTAWLPKSVLIANDGIKTGTYDIKPWFMNVIKSKRIK